MRDDSNDVSRRPGHSPISTSPSLAPESARPASAASSAGSGALDVARACSTRRRAFARVSRRTALGAHHACAAGGRGGRATRPRGARVVRAGAGPAGGQANRANKGRGVPPERARAWGGGGGGQGRGAAPHTRKPAGQRSAQQSRPPAASARGSRARQAARRTCEPGSPRQSWQAGSLKLESDILSPYESTSIGIVCGASRPPSCRPSVVVTSLTCARWRAVAARGGRGASAIQRGERSAVWPGRRGGGRRCFECSAIGHGSGWAAATARRASARAAALRRRRRRVRTCRESPRQAARRGHILKTEPVSSRSSVLFSPRAVALASCMPHACRAAAAICAARREGLGGRRLVRRGEARRRARRLSPTTRHGRKSSSCCCSSSSRHRRARARSAPHASRVPRGRGRGLAPPAPAAGSGRRRAGSRSRASGGHRSSGACAPGYAAAQGGRASSPPERWCP